MTVKSELRIVTFLGLAVVFLSAPVFELQAQTDSGAMSDAIHKLSTVSSTTLPDMQAGENGGAPQPIFTFDRIKAEVAKSGGALPKSAQNFTGSMNQGTSPRDQAVEVSYAIPANNLVLEILPSTNGFARLILHGASNEVYELMSKVSLHVGAWQPEQALHRSTNQAGIFTVVPVLDRTNTLFFWARDWTGIDENQNGIPDWWEWENFGALTLDVAKDFDGSGVSIRETYRRRDEPNKVRFSIEVESFHVSDRLLPLDIEVERGHPFSMAVLVDSTNYVDAVWQPFNPKLKVDLGLTEGWHEVRVGLRGRANTSRQTWQWRRFSLEKTPPTLTIVSPTNAVISGPFLQIEGTSSESVTSLTYDLYNAAGGKTNQYIVTGSYASNLDEPMKKIHFRCVDVEVVAGTNLITLKATDEAGNNATKTVCYVMNPNIETNPPVINLHWPTDGTQIGQDRVTWRGFVNNPATAIMVSSVVTNGANQTFPAIVERDGSFWVENIPLQPGTNRLILDATGPGGLKSNTNIMVVRSGLDLKINLLSPSDISASGSISQPGYTVWVNKVKAGQSTDGKWQTELLRSVRSHSDTTFILMVRAIPNGDHGGNGTPSNINPTSSGAVDAEATVVIESGTCILSQTIQERIDYLSPDLSADKPGLIASEEEMGWTYGLGGKREFKQWYADASSTNVVITEYQWPPSRWPEPLPAGTSRIWSTQTGTWQTNSLPAPPPFNPKKWEHCDVDYVTSDGRKHIRRYADVVVGLSTGGKAIAGRKSLHSISAGATAKSDEDLPTPKSTPIPSEKIQIGTMGHLGSDGKLWIVLPDGLP